MRKLLLFAFNLILITCLLAQEEMITPDEKLFDADTMEDGGYVSRYPDGNVLYVGKIKDGKKEGIWKYYYPNGALHEVITFKNGERNGNSRKLDQYGVIINETTYKNNILDGPYLEFYEDGSLALKGH